jgi:hypothetical protein
MNNAVVKPDYNFPKVKSIRVHQFLLEKDYRGISDAIQNVFYKTF